jgi:murein DD-endopeptidase MepM/ murein hydrolase activator NlpD
MKLVRLLLVCTLLLTACSQASAAARPPATSPTASPAPSLTPAPTLTATVTVTSTPPASATPLPTATATSLPPTQVVSTCPPPGDVCILEGHFFFQRPIAPENNDSVDESYRYGLTQNGAREPHHGVEFPNAQGTPVLAAADGLVAYAGNDKNTLLSWITNYYGNVVVLVHQVPGLTKPVYTLYAHLFKVGVERSQRVKAGDVIGRVGATGAAIGSHLHFEVRLGQDNYRSNRNPDLWLVPHQGQGVLAGHIIDSSGRSLDGMINVQRVVDGVLNPLPVTALQTYDTRELMPVHLDDDLGETFAAGDLPAGQYRLTMHLNGVLYEKLVKIEAGQLTFINFMVK